MTTDKVQRDLIEVCDRALQIHGLPTYSALREREQMLDLALRAVLASVPLPNSHRALKARVEALLAGES